MSKWETTEAAHAAVDELLRSYYRGRRTPPAESEHDQNTILAPVIADRATDQQRRAAVALLTSDRELTEAVLVISGSGQKVPPQSSSRYLAGVRRMRFAITLAAAAAVSIVALRFSVRDEFRPNASLSAKGSGDSFDIAVERGAERFRVKSGQKIEAGDRLGFFYTAEKPGYLTVFSADASGDLTTLHPAGGQFSAPITPGERLPLPDGAIADEGRGCAWIVAVFSEHALAISGVRGALEDAVRSSRDCELMLQVGGARAVDVVPLMR